MVVADLELVNLFGSVEWPCILNALQRFFSYCLRLDRLATPAGLRYPASAGSSWCTNRGAEQGGSVWHHLQRVSPGHRTCGVCDEWYIDDGQVPVRLTLFDSWLRALDMALFSFGATRGSPEQGIAKSSARLLCPPERRHEFPGLGHCLCAAHAASVQTR